MWVLSGTTDRRGAGLGVGRATEMVGEAGITSQGPERLGCSAHPPRLSPDCSQLQLSGAPEVSESLGVTALLEGRWGAGVCRHHFPFPWTRGREARLPLEELAGARRQ